MKIYLFLTVFFCATLCKASTDTSFQAIKTIKGSYTNFTLDNLGNVFLLDEQNQIKKLDNRFDSVAIYNNVRRYGELFAIDASNPLKILLFYKDFMTVVTLDRFLQPLNSIDLRQAGIFQCSTICQSYDNNIWLFDELENKIKKIDDNGKELLESADFRILFDEPPRPTKLEDYHKYLFAYDSSKGLLVMDYYGSYKNLIALKGLKNVHGIDKGIVAIDSTGLIYFEPNTIEIKHQTLPNDILNSKKILINGEQLYVLFYDGTIRVYQIK